MLRIEFHHGSDAIVMRIEGRLVGTFAEDARNLVSSKPIPVGLVVDLSELSYVDVVGEDVLCWLGRLGCKFMPGNIYSSYICKTLNLPLARANGNGTHGV